MLLRVFSDRPALGAAAAKQAATAIRRAVASHGKARVVAATAASQREFLIALTSTSEIDWSKVEVFHLDEYIGLPITHPGSFRKMLLEQLVQRTGITQYHLLDGDAADPAQVVKRVGDELASAPIDIAFLGVGENCHIAFNDPPVADFNDPLDVKIVHLDEPCRRQQAAEGWFKSVDEIPKSAITVTMSALLRVPKLVLSVVGARKANIVRRTFDDPIATACPSTILRTHPDATIFMDREAAAQVQKRLSAHSGRI